MPVISNALGVQEMELTEGGECLIIDLFVVRGSIVGFGEQFGQKSGEGAMRTFEDVLACMITLSFRL
jgi:hypothetical protein